MMAEEANLGLRAEGRQYAEEFLGSWSLVSCEQVLSTGEVLKPFGDAPLGSIQYLADGHMSAQVSVRNRPKLSGEDLLKTSDEEASDAFRSYLGYWGSYTVFAERHVVVHRLEGSSFPNWVGTEQIRHFRFDDSNRLILEAQLPAGHFKLTWRK